MLKVAEERDKLKKTNEISVAKEVIALKIMAMTVLCTLHRLRNS